MNIPQNTVVIGLCVYNNEFGLPFVFENIRTLKQVLSVTKIIICYDHSSDNSLKIIEDEIRKSPDEFILIQNQNLKSHHRTENISNARNMILNKIREMFSETKYMIMMDSNEYSCVGKIQIDPIRSVLLRESEWDAISFDRDAGYYDHWALSFNPFIYSFFHFPNFQPVVAKFREIFGKILSDYKTFKPDEYIPVYSAFNGFSIYKWETFKYCNYSSNINLSLFPSDIIQKQIDIVNQPIIQQYKNDCEHRHFHLQGINERNAKIRICTKSVFAKFEGKLPSNCRGPA